RPELVGQGLNHHLPNRLRRVLPSLFVRCRQGAVTVSRLPVCINRGLPGWNFARLCRTERQRITIWLLTVTVSPAQKTSCRPWLTVALQLKGCPSQILPRHRATVTVSR